MKVLLFVAVALVAAAQAIELKPVKSSLFPNYPKLINKLHKIDPRITGGDEVNPPHSLPYQVGLFIHAADGTFFCGGSLLSTTTVVTAAHCGELSQNIEVILGAHNVRVEEDTQVRINGSKVLVHPKWDRLLLQNDIALIILPAPVELNENIQTVPLPSDVTNNFEGDLATASGWGKDSDDAQAISSVLREVTVPVGSNSGCNIYYFGVITENHLCIDTKGGKSTCNGDSGGPLVSSSGELIGITSFGISLGCEIGWPGVFTRASSYVDWIKENSDV